MTRRGLHRLIRHPGPRRKAVVLGALGITVVLGLTATMVPLLADDDVSIPVVADTTATAVMQDGDNSVKSTLATCPARCDGNPRGGRDAVLAFMVTTLPANATNVRATLRVHAWQAFKATVSAHASNLDATAQRPAPERLASALDTVTGVAKGFNEWDVSGLVTGNGIWTVSLAQAGLDTRIYWASAENRSADLRPNLVLSYEVAGRPAPPPPPSATLPPPPSRRGRPSRRARRPASRPA